MIKHHAELPIGLAVAGLAASAAQRAKIRGGMMITFDFSNRVAVVTGAGGGIGLPLPGASRRPAVRY